MALLKLSRSQILAFRLESNSLNERLPLNAASLRRAAWAGLQDSAPRAALLSIHARVAGTTAEHWEHSSLVQLWGLRFNDYVIAAQDLAVFSLSRLPKGGTQLARAHDTANRLHAFLEGRRLPFGQVGHAMGVSPNSLRYAAPTGRVLLRWDGARQPIIWTVPPPEIDPAEARRELARRYLHILGPARPSSFAKWAGVPESAARSAFASLELIPVQTPIGDASILASDEPAFRAQPQSAPAPARLLPAGDAFFLAWGADREILLPDSKHRSLLWTSRVWPGLLLVNGEPAGTWRRASAQVTIDPWRRLTTAERTAVEAEAVSLPLPSLERRVSALWNRR